MNEARETLSNSAQEVMHLTFILVLQNLKLFGAAGTLMWFSSVPTKVQITFIMKLRAEYIWETFPTIQSRIFYFPIPYLKT
jgi:hypothetical protein